MELTTLCRGGAASASPWGNLAVNSWHWQCLNALDLRPPLKARKGLSSRPDENGANVVLWAFLMCFLCFQAFEQTDQEQHRRIVEAAATSRHGGEEEAQPRRIRTRHRSRGKSAQGRGIRLGLYSRLKSISTSSTIEG